MISTSETVKELYTALSKAQSVMASAKRTADNPFFKSKYADLDEIWAVAKKPLTDNGLSVMQFPTDGENDKITIICRLCHSSGEWAESSLSLKPTKQDPQAIGSAITYGRRYLLAAIVGVVTDDDDGNAASDPNGKASTKPSDQKENPAKSICSDKQMELIINLCKSPVITGDEKTKIEKRGIDKTLDGSKTIAWLQTEIASRNEVLKQEQANGAKA